MATTTTNYGFDIPTSSDLVKNGATAIATLGQDIDTFLYRPIAKNFCYNSGFDIWQRGTTFAITSVSNTYTADRWQVTLNQRTSGTLTINQNTSQKQTSDNYCFEMDASALVTTSVLNLTQILETLDVVPLRGKVVTASAWMKVASGTATVGQLIQDGTDTNAFPSTGTTADSLNASVTTTWTRFSLTHTVANGANSLAYRLTTPSAFAGKLYVSQVQFEVLPSGAPNPTLWTRQNATIQGELSACQRYYLDTRNGTDQPFSGYSNSTDYLLANVRYPVTMRTTPSVTIGQASGSNYVRRISTNAQIAITVTSYPGTNSGGFSAVYAVAAPFVAAVGYDFYILASAEL
jgi:hypothetical protein